jgi:flavin-dependent dehydrogenase
MTFSHMPDVLVVGGSVTGAAVATHLVRRGHSVQLLERARFPRRKACGEGLFAMGTRALYELGLLSKLRPEAGIIDSLRLEMDGYTVEAPLREAIGIRREVLDIALLDLAVTAGVDVCCGVTVTGLIESDGAFEGVQTDQGDFKAKLVIAADGLQSRLRRAAGLDVSASANGRYGVSAHFELPEAPARRVDIHFEDGYEVYLTPVGGHVMNVALLLEARQARGLGGRLTAGYEALVAASNALSPNADRIDAPIVGGPFHARSKHAYRANLLLAGDAAGFYDGISGDGMSLALTGARRCTDAAHAFLQGGDQRHFGDQRHLARYDAQLRSQARNSTLLARLNLALASRPALGRRALRNLARCPETFAKLVAINQGLEGLSALRPADLRALLFG